MLCQAVILFLYMLLLLLSILFEQSLGLKNSHFYKVEKNEGVSNLSTFKKLTVRSVVECVSTCEVDDKCFMATYRNSTNECYVQTNGCAVQETIAAVGWIVFHKTDDCFKTCKAQMNPWWQYFCAGTTNGWAYCYPDQDLVILPSVYGSVNCHAGSALTAFPSCGKYVTDIMGTLCNGRFNCTFNVKPSMFGTTNCGGGENLFLRYECHTNDAKCHNTCQSTC